MIDCAVIALEGDLIHKIPARARLGKEHQREELADQDRQLKKERTN